MFVDVMDFEERESAIIFYEDKDGFDLADIDIQVKPGWELVGDTGYVNDYGWNDIDWPSIGDDYAHFADNTCVTLKEFPDLPDGYCEIIISHDDDDPDNEGTSGTKAWWAAYVFKEVTANA